jgi:6-phosphogluconolactonase (cycloisomerase 2 family)
MTGKMIQQGVSRRRFVMGAAAVVLAPSFMSEAESAGHDKKTGRVLAYVGTYTGTRSNGEGIYLFEMNEATGELSGRKLVAKTPAPSWIAIHPSKKYLYAVNERGDYQGHSGSVSAFAIDAASGDLTALNVVSSEGAGPCYLSIDAEGKYAFVANYDGGTVAVLPILEDGTLGAATDIHRDSGQLGSKQAANAPRGNFAISGHDAPHAHMIAPDPQGKFILATDLGQDRIYSYHFDRSTGKMSPQEGAPFAGLSSGDGPRHFAFHPNGHWLYSFQEESSTIAVFHYDAETGSLSAQQTVSALPEGFAGTSYASEIVVAPNGKFLYAANRLHDTIAAFSIDAEGRLKWIGETSTLGDYPGQFRIDPSGNFLYVCNLRSDNIACFRIHRETGALSFTGQYTAVGSPGSITFLS